MRAYIINNLQKQDRQVWKFLNV